MAFDESPLPMRRRSVINDDIEFSAFAMNGIESRPSLRIAEIPLAAPALQITT
jgi:hypothetical protein